MRREVVAVAGLAELAFPAAAAVTGIAVLVVADVDPKLCGLEGAVAAGERLADELLLAPDWVPNHATTRRW